MWRQILGLPVAGGDGTLDLLGQASLQLCHAAPCSLAPATLRKDYYEYLLARGRDLMGSAGVPPTVSDGSSQLVGQKQSWYCNQGIRRGRAELTSRTWTGHPWRGLTAQEEEGRRPTQRSTRRGRDFPTCFSEREHTGSPCKGARPEIELLVHAWAGAG